MKKILFSLLMMTAVLSVVIPVNNQAAEFIKQDEAGNVSLTDTTKRYENVYAGGNNINIKAPILKDLYLGGSNITIESPIERSLFVGGSNITIKNTTIGGGAKIGGSNVTLDNVTVEDDVFIGASTLTITNSNIKGDLLVGTSTITMTGSTVAKNMYYGGPKNETLKAQVKGELKQDTEIMVKDKMTKDESKGFGYYFYAVGIFSSLVVLLTEIFILSKYNKIRDKRIGFNFEGKSFQHLGNGALLFILIPLLIIGAFASLGFLAPITINLAAILTLFFFLLSPLTSYYLANLIFGDNVVWWHPIIIFIIVNILGFIPILGGIVGFVMFLLGLMTTGYYASKALSAFRRELEA